MAKLRGCKITFLREYYRQIVKIRILCQQYLPVGSGSDYSPSAPLTGLEPATIGLEVQCSVQLSYRGRKIEVEIITWPYLRTGRIPL